jgi:hypothetical protein
MILPITGAVNQAYQAARLDLGFYLLADGELRHFEIVGRLQAKPEIGTRSEKASKAQGRLRRHGSVPLEGTPKLRH